MTGICPGSQRVPDRRLELYIRRDFLSPAQCRGLTAMIEAQRRPSQIVDDIGDPLFRTSETCDLDASAPLVAEVDAMLATYLALDPSHGEPLQGQRYAVGQEFKAHTDYFEPGGGDYAVHCGISGQRTWTAMLYLNAPDAGGATYFKSIGKMVQPESGKLLCWNNLDDQGRPNPWTLHHGMKVRRGVKYVITKWFRQKPWFAPQT